jgi:hypothetical protein
MVLSEQLTALRTQSLVPETLLESPVSAILVADRVRQAKAHKSMVLRARI